MELPQSYPSLPPSSSSSTSSTPTPRRRGFLAGFVLGAIGIGALGFAIGATMPAAEAALGMAAHGGFGDDGPPTPEEIRDKAEFFVGFALHRLDATDDQEERVNRIVGGAIDELFPVVQEHRSNKEELRAIFGAPTIDRAALEKLRNEELALADSMSRIVVEAVADSAEVLTPEQRSELLERIARFRHRH